MPNSTGTGKSPVILTVRLIATMSKSARMFPSWFFEPELVEWGARIAGTVSTLFEMIQE